MIEAAAIIGADEQTVLCWHLPEGRTSASVPDAPELSAEERAEVAGASTLRLRGLVGLLSTHHRQMAGTAHTHPGGGVPSPSWSDITSYAVWEKYLHGKRYKHWILSMERAVVVTWQGPGRYEYAVQIIDKDKEPVWAEQLRRKSLDETTGAALAAGGA